MSLTASRRAPQVHRPHGDLREQALLGTAERLLEAGRISSTSVAGLFAGKARSSMSWLPCSPPAGDER